MTEQVARRTCGKRFPGEEISHHQKQHRTRRFGGPRGGRDCGILQGTDRSTLFVLVTAGGQRQDRMTRIRHRCPWMGQWGP